MFERIAIRISSETNIGAVAALQWIFASYCWIFSGCRTCSTVHKVTIKNWSLIIATIICQKVHLHHNSFMISSQNGQAGEEASWWNNGRAKYASTTKLAWFVKTTGNRSLLICRFSPQVKAICYGCPPVFLSSDGSGVEEDVLAVSSVGLNWSNYIYQLPHPVFSAKKKGLSYKFRLVLF